MSGSGRVGKLVENAILVAVASLVVSVVWGNKENASSHDRDIAAINQRIAVVITVICQANPATSACLRSNGGLDIVGIMKLGLDK